MKNIKLHLKLINILADGFFHSNEQLGNITGMSYVAIYKHIQIIREWGLNIFTLYDKGYYLPYPIQLLNKQLILSYTPLRQVNVLSIVDSTNQYLLEHINELQSGDACVAEYQSAGRGRYGRQWISPFGVNLYLSMYWYLKQGCSATIGLSLVIGIVIAEVLKKLGVHDIRVKWPNDIYLYNKKLAGILIELISNTGNGTQLIIGIGINILMRRSHTELIDQDWINLEEVGINIDRNQLTVELLSVLQYEISQFEKNGLTDFIPRWFRLDNYLNRPVKLIIGDQEILGINIGINLQGALLLEQNGIKRIYFGGEISLRGL
ncbi:bifunctional biotin--[acetyl-CoA-carboxylase] ligase/biotin operon repressor BirA [Candidatus Fukatsuia anoeciicola]|uniref:bifunctional biotin--[acetyl-CoA-carboxylase] ligase/biotin operon repressor BirA n=1 Tax=Candidatus Fukatsuia anoeciicola TaxID=2994492 RepID=UPI0034641A41